jgi:hypothetical protein
MTGDMGASFKKLVDGMYIRYRSCLVEVCNGGYKVGSAWFSSLDAAYERIDRDLGIIGESISRVPGSGQKEP